MDAETLTILRNSITDWCARNEKLIAALDQKDSGREQYARAFDSLGELGVLDILHDPESRHEIAALARLAYSLARYSSALALLTVQQNLAAALIGADGGDMPGGWVSLPLYDAPIEWEHLLESRREGGDTLVSGAWNGLPALPVAAEAMLPVFDGAGGPFSLVRIDLANADEKIEIGPRLTTLGLRGVPHADITLSGYRVPPAPDATAGASGHHPAIALWSQAEACMQAIRAAILERSYLTAAEYAGTRRQGRRAIIGHSVIRNMLAAMQRQTGRFNRCWEQAADAARPDEPLPPAVLTEMIECQAVLPQLASDGLQILGGNGYMEEFGQEGLFRDAKQCQMLLGHPQAKKLTLWEGRTA